MSNAENERCALIYDIDFNCSNEMAISAMLNSQNANVRCVWIANSVCASSQTQRLSDLRTVGITIVSDNQIDVLMKLCDSIATQREKTTTEWDLFIDDYDFLYENTKSFLENHRKIFRGVGKTKYHRCLL
jgi:hypothetical protein